MRQAGRYQRAYRDIRAGTTMMGLCRDSSLAAEVTLMAVDRLGVDAAIIFSDILTVAEPLGFSLDFVKGDGPVIGNPFRERADIARLRKADPAELSYVYDAVRITRAALRPDIALIGFCGGPFTVASYLIEGGKSKDYARTKTLMYRDALSWNALMDRLVDLEIAYLANQIAAGADAVQIFDSWAGNLSPDDYRQYVMPHVKRLEAGVGLALPAIERAGASPRPAEPALRAPIIHFATGNPALLPLMKQAGGDVIGLDFRVDLADAWRTLGDDVAVMGNLDPVVLFCSPAEIRQRAKAILDKAAGRPGHIFNLGHGITPDMPPENVAELVDAVHELSQR
jgi:uroporphyrinogen decarboxylase